MKIRWFGHDTFLIETEGKRIYTDPYILPMRTELADIILVSHDHFDHCDPSRINEIRSQNTKVICPETCGEKIGGDLHVMKEWSTVEISGIGIQAVPAYNMTRSFHPRGKGLGYVIESEGKRIYFTGDTDIIPDMDKIKGIDVLIVPIGSQAYMMSTEDAVQVCSLIKPKICIPMHYNHLDATMADPNEFRQKVESSSETKVEILEGRTLEI
ncbi:MAG: MBL fold metallo-hydrolase [Candidatus Aenigmarchaeota archaeon]|nr:MBL fold metallo-hydrolase [Candidatus Aenigmarchaeota archaeon]